MIDRVNWHCSHIRIRWWNESVHGAVCGSGGELSQGLRYAPMWKSRSTNFGCFAIIFEFRRCLPKIVPQQWQPYDERNRLIPLIQGPHWSVYKQVEGLLSMFGRSIYYDKIIYLMSEQPLSIRTTVRHSRATAARLQHSSEVFIVATFEWWFGAKMAQAGRPNWTPRACDQSRSNWRHHVRVLTSVVRIMFHLVIKHVIWRSMSFDESLTRHVLFDHEKKSFVVVRICHLMEHVIRLHMHVISSISCSQIHSTYTCRPTHFTIHTLNDISNFIRYVFHI